MTESHKTAGRYSLPFLIYFAYTLTKGLWLGGLEGAAFWAADFVSFVVIPAALVVAYRLPVRLSELRTRRANRPEGFLVPVVVNGFLIAFVMRMIFIFGSLAFSRWGIDESVILPPSVVYEARVPKEGVWLYVCIVYFALTAALVEEYFFRFLLRRALLPYTAATLPFVLVSSVTFALVHWGGGLLNLCAAFPAGALLAWAYVKASDLRLPVVGHAFYWLRLLFR